MSLGVNLLAALVKRVAQTLDENYDIEILEMHHNKKIDAPSGTALMLGRAAAAGRGIDLAAHSVRGRDGMTGARTRGDIGFASLRGGTVVGDHTVTFAGPAERLELTHRAEDRMIFARGALHAALWARGKKPGLYSMADVLGLRTSDNPRLNPALPSGRLRKLNFNCSSLWMRVSRAIGVVWRSVAYPYSHDASCVSRSRGSHGDDETHPFFCDRYPGFWRVGGLRGRYGTASLQVALSAPAAADL